MSRFVADNFEAAWESMRPVPRVTIDFGEGCKLERTARGNVATWLCAPDGRVLDVVPGLCDPVTFLRRLQAAAALAGRYATDRVAFEAEYRLAHRSARPMSAPAPRIDVSKVEVEGPLLGGTVAQVGSSPTRPAAPRPPDPGKTVTEANTFELANLVVPRPPSAPPDRSKGLVEAPTLHGMDTLALAEGGAIADRILLQLDSDTNRATRDPLVRALLAERAWTPRELDRRLFRDVLHVDLDDPWLGLADGPFGGGAYEGHDRVR